MCSAQIIIFTEHFVRNSKQVNALPYMLNYLNSSEMQFVRTMLMLRAYFANSWLQCFSVLSDILVTNELCIPLERKSNVLSTGEGFICLSPPSKLKIDVLFSSIYKMTISFSTTVF